MNSCSVLNVRLGLLFLMAAHALTLLNSSNVKSNTALNKIIIGTVLHVRRYRTLLQPLFVYVTNSGACHPSGVVIPQLTMRSGMRAVQGPLTYFTSCCVYNGGQHEEE